jgi:hypothetical protein
MSSRSNPVDPLFLRKQNFLRAFYASSVACGIVFGVAQYLRGLLRHSLFGVSLVGAILAVWTLVRFLRVIDEFEARYMYGALRIAFVGILCLLAVEAFLESFGFPRVPGYGNALCAVILWSLGLTITSWRQHWRREHEE